jgi:nucleotide-binding universal stress UspA family protein
MFGAIVVGTDGSATAREAVTQAAELARLCGATLHIVCAYEPPRVQPLRGEPRASATGEREWALNARAEAQATLTEAAAIAAASGARAECYARQGDPADAILDVAEERSAQLVIVGNKGMTGAERFLLGSVPNKVSHHAPCSVLIIRTS